MNHVPAETPASASSPQAGQFFERAVELLCATGVSRWSKHVGDQVMSVTLPDAQGEAIALSDLWQKGPLVVVFYRGSWCGSCIRQLRAWQANQDALTRLGAHLVAISPEPPDQKIKTARTHNLTYTLLSDLRMDAANGFQVALSLPPELVDMYAYVGADAPVLDAQGQWALPIPATFLVGCEGHIRFAHVDLDASKRIAPEAVLPAVRDLLAGCLRP